MVKYTSQLNQEIGAVLRSSRKAAPSKERRLAREVKETLEGQGFSGSPRPWSLAFDSRPFLKRIEGHKRAEDVHRKRLLTFEAQLEQLQAQIQTAPPRQQAALRRRLASIPGKIREQRAAIDAARNARSREAKELELARSSQVWERKIEAAKRREAGVVATREGIAVVGRRIGTDPGAEGHPPILSSTAPRHYAETPGFRIGGPGSTISGGPEVPRGTTSIWQPTDETKQRARPERRSKPSKTSEEWYEHDVRAARERQEQAKQARDRYESFRAAEGRRESATALPVAMTHVVSRRARAGAFLRGLLPKSR
jgi:hypothetical protein